MIVMFDRSFYYIHPSSTESHYLAAGFLAAAFFLAGVFLGLAATFFLGAAFLAGDFFGDAPEAGDEDAAATSDAVSSLTGANAFAGDAAFFGLAFLAAVFLAAGFLAFGLAAFFAGAFFLAGDLAFLAGDAGAAGAEPSPSLFTGDFGGDRDRLAGDFFEVAFLAAPLARGLAAAFFLGAAFFGLLAALAPSPLDAAGRFVAVFLAGDFDLAGLLAAFAFGARGFRATALVAPASFAAPPPASGLLAVFAILNSNLSRPSKLVDQTIYVVD